MNKVLKDILKILILIISLVAIDRFISFEIEPVKYSDFLRNDPVYKAAKREGSDLIFIGGSHMEMGMDPKIFVEKSGMKNVLNVSATDQPIKGGYFYSKQLIKECRPKRIVYDISNQELYSPEVLMGKMNIMDKLSFPYNLEYYLNDRDLEKNSASLISRSYRFSSYFRGGSQTKREEMAHEGYIEAENYEYGGFERVWSYSEGMVPMNSYLGDNSSDVISEESLNYLLKIKKLCDDNGVIFYTCSCPLSMSALYGTPDYEERVGRYARWAKENGIKYHNLSLLKGREEIIGDNVWDVGHLSGDGADAVSAVYADILAAEEEGSDTSEFFYSSLEELKSDTKRIVSVGASFVRDGDNIEITVDSRHNDDIIPEYYVVLVAMGEERVIIDWKNENHAIIPVGDLLLDYYIEVRARVNEDDTKQAYQYYQGSAI